MIARVNVLLSTCNGARFIEELLESILNQSFRNIVLHIRDDGSIDETPIIIRYYADRYENIKFISGGNLGVIASFFSLLQDADENCDYFAFCDQDDFWLPDKLADAISSLERFELSQPLLYCSRLEYTDARLNHLGYSAIPRKAAFANALVENIVTGCTAVINRQAREVILQAEPSRIIMHDWWFYLIVSAFGTVIYDQKANVKYRQHESNLIGAAPGLMGKWYRRLRNILKKRQACNILEQAGEFRNIYLTSLNPENQKVLNKFLDSQRNTRTRIKYSFNSEVWRQNKLDNFIFRLLLASGYYISKQDRGGERC